MIDLEATIAENAPKVAYADAVEAADQDWLPSEVAKALSPALRMGWRRTRKRSSRRVGECGCSSSSRRCV